MRKIETLKKNYEFKNVINKGTFLCGKYIIIYFYKNKLDKNVIGIAINTKTAKAVKRNRIKRLIRENYRLQKDKIKKGYNMVFLWNQKADIEKVTFNDIQKDFINIFNKNNMFLK